MLNQIVNSTVKVTYALALNTSNRKKKTIGKHLLRDVGHKIPNEILCSVLNSGNTNVEQTYLVFHGLCNRSIRTGALISSVWDLIEQVS